MPGSSLSQDIRALKGVGEKRAQCYNKLGVHTVYSLLRFYPRDYIDYSAPCAVSYTHLTLPTILRV